MEFKLPASSYEQLIKIISVYAISNKYLTTAEVSDKINAYKGNIDKNIPFLTIIGILEKDPENKNKYKITNIGNSLYRAIDGNLDDFVSEHWRTIIIKNDFLNELSKDLEINKRYYRQRLIDYIIYKADAKVHGFSKAGASAIIDIIIKSNIAIEKDGNIIVFNPEFSKAKILQDKVNAEKEAIMENYNQNNNNEEELKEKIEYIDNLVDEVTSESTDVTNTKLSQKYNDRIKDLKKTYSIYNKIFIGMIIFDIIAVIVLFIINVFLFKETNGNNYIAYNVRISILSISILGLLFWATKYFNRRVHETVFLLEEYEHKFLVINSFISYSRELERLRNEKNTFLEDYISKVSTTINKSPAQNLNKRKGDNTPLEEVIELLKNFYSFSKNNKE
ncbi:hypothetical protein WESB_2362 [Brachyspira pilosicoli WesB]|uniref:Uncharacterized protein n=1 Tax=Brachyspira pilosicoli WesB TaxID=1161918 RepID=K0JLA4_BRAPL|nr:hypothetical protein [Brachyspira pilosicoli]CCG57824.1 hypothetical protein WESB_2362 [Brachyspira pilosicoli WesB]